MRAQVNSPPALKEQSQRVEVYAQIARAHLRDAQSALQSHGSVEFALSKLIKASFIFADCLNKLREAVSSQEVLLSEPGALSHLTTDPFEAIFPGTFCCSKDLILFLSRSEIFFDYSTN